MAARIISALIALPIVLYLVHLGGWGFGGLVLFVGLVCLYEFMGMTQKQDGLTRVLMTGLGGALMLGIMTGKMASLPGMVVFTALPIVVVVYFLFRTGDMQTVGARASFAFTGLFWAGGLLAVTASLRSLPGGDGWLILACVLAWGSDTGGYFAGRFLGKHKLYPKVSPKKTWEGSVGGVIAATGGAFICREVLGPQVDTTHLLIMAPLAAVFGQIGDLAESMLKRTVNVKDSGTIMPGHGGLFDRVDALIFVGPTLFAYATLVLGQPLQWLPFPW